MKKAIFVLLLILVGNSPIPLFAFRPDSLSKDFEDWKKKFPTETNVKVGEQTIEPTVLKSYNEARKSDYELHTNLNNYYSRSFLIRDETFKWQIFSSKIIFLTVLLVVFCGLIFAGIQFYIAMKSINKHIVKEIDSNNVNTNDIPVANIELSVQGLKVNSSILGVIILVISLAFFYLYLIYVYPINEAKIDSNATKESTK